MVLKTKRQHMSSSQSNLNVYSDDDCVEENILGLFVSSMSVLSGWLLFCAVFTVDEME